MQSNKYIPEESLSHNNDIHSHFSKNIPYQEKSPKEILLSQVPTSVENTRRANKNHGKGMGSEIMQTWIYQVNLSRCLLGTNSLKMWKNLISPAKPKEFKQ